MILFQSLQESAQWIFDVKNIMPIGKQSADPIIVLALHREETSLVFDGLLPCLSYPKTFDPLVLSLYVSNGLEILIYFDAISQLLSKYVKPLM